MNLRMPIINPEKNFQRYLELVREFTNFPSTIRKNPRLFKEAVFNLSELYFQKRIPQELKRRAECITAPISVEYFIGD